MQNTQDQDQAQISLYVDKAENWQDPNLVWVIYWCDGFTDKTSQSWLLCFYPPRWLLYPSVEIIFLLVMRAENTAQQGQIML